MQKLRHFVHPLASIPKFSSSFLNLQSSSIYVQSSLLSTSSSTLSTSNYFLPQHLTSFFPSNAPSPFLSTATLHHQFPQSYIYAKTLSFTAGLGASFAYFEHDSTQSTTLPSSPSFFSTLVPAFPSTLTHILSHNYIAYANPIPLENRTRAGSFAHRGNDRFEHGGLRQDMFLEFPMIHKQQLGGNKWVYLFQTAEDMERIKMPATSFIVARVENPDYLSCKNAYLQTTLEQNETVHIENEFGVSVQNVPKKQPVNPSKHYKEYQVWKKNTQLNLQDNKHTFIYSPDGEKIEKYVHAAFFPTFDDEIGRFGILIDPDTSQKYDFNDSNRNTISNAFKKFRYGDCAEFLGPFYTDFAYRPYTFEEIIMVVGDPNGVLPMLQIVRQIHDDVNDKTRIHVIYCNKNSETVCFDQALNTFRNHRMGQAVVSWLFEENAGVLDFQRGFIENVHYGALTKYKLHRLVGKHSQNRNSKRKILVAGPNSFMKQVCGKKKKDGTQGELSGWLHELGYSDFHVMKF